MVSMDLEILMTPSVPSRTKPLREGRGSVRAKKQCRRTSLIEPYSVKSNWRSASQFGSEGYAVMQTPQLLSLRMCVSCS